MASRSVLLVLVPLASLLACAAPTAAPGGDSAHAAEHLPIHVVAQGEAASGAEESCQRLGTPAEWRLWRAATGGSAASLPDRVCDFGGEGLVVVVVAVAEPRFRWTTTEEEGVDVLVAAAEGGPAAGAEAGARRAWSVLVVPRRPAQLAVVLQRSWQGVPQDERTLAVFAPR